MTLNKNLAE
jgi:serine/threonine protein kinase